MINTPYDVFEQEIAEAVRVKADSLSLHGGSHRHPLPKSLLNPPPGLRHLRLECFFTDSPDFLTKLNSLESLEIGEADGISNLVPHFWKLANLRHLKLAYSCDGLTDLPSSLSELKHLEELNIDGADFEHFPAVIASLSSLRSLSFEYCKCPLPEVFEALIALPLLKKLRLTYSACYGVNLLPESFGRLQSIEELHFNNWPDLQALPESLVSRAVNAFNK